MDLNNIHEDWKKDAPNLAAMEAANPFTIPENYFNNSREQLLARISIEHLTGSDAAGAFSVPEGYFERLEKQIIARTTLEDLKEEAVFTVPDGYFEELPGNIRSRIQVEAVLLPAESAQQGFTIPDGYFDKLQQQILAKTVEPKEETPVIKIQVRSAQWIRFAAAACITAVIGTAVFLNYSKTQQPDINSALAEIPETEIVNYLQVNSSIDDSEAIAEHLTEAGIKPSLNNVFSEEEIESYLETSL